MSAIETVTSSHAAPRSLVVRLRQMERAANRCGWSICSADFDVDSRHLSLRLVKGSLAQPEAEALVAGTPDRACMERTAFRYGREPRGRKGDRYISETREPVFLGREWGNARDMLSALGAYIEANPRRIAGSKPASIKG